MAHRVLLGKVCLVTGATRGIGKGIALQLAEAGATVYITGRTLNRTPDNKTGSLTDTAKEIEERGGVCIPIQCDHSKDDEVKQLFDKIKREQNGQLDVLVNNAYSAVTAIFDNLGKKFWELEPDMWDISNNVGLRNHYVCSVYASRMMTERKKGLIVNISSAGGLKYLFNVPYGVGKAAVDRMAADCGEELKKFNVAYISLWPGAVQTELITQIMKTNKREKHMQLARVFENGETPEFAGKCVVYLANDPDIMKKTGRVVMTPDLGLEYSFTDIDGRTIDSFRQFNLWFRSIGYERLAQITPSFIKVPYWVLSLVGGKF